MAALDAPPRELIIDARAAPGDSSDGAGSAMAPFAMTAVAAWLLAKFVTPTAALIPFALAIAVLIIRRRSHEGRFVLRVDGDALEVRRERRGAPPIRIALTDLVDVTVDRHTHHGGRGGAATERVRLALERRAPEEPVFVPDERVTPIEGQEWYGKVRVFLRKHGWVPENEHDADVTRPDAR